MTPVTHQGLLVHLADLVAAASPGPSTMAIRGMAMAQGRRAALLLASGVTTGSMICGGTAALGMSRLLARSAGVLTRLKAAGGLSLPPQESTQGPC